MATSCKVTYQDFKEITKELSPNQMKRYFNHLDMPLYARDNAEFSAGTDPVVRAQHVFEELRKKLGNKLTIASLHEAKRKTFDVSTSDMAKISYDELIEVTNGLTNKEVEHLFRHHGIPFNIIQNVKSSDGEDYQDWAWRLVNDVKPSGNYVTRESLLEAKEKLTSATENGHASVCTNCFIKDYEQPRPSWGLLQYFLSRLPNNLFFPMVGLFSFLSGFVPPLLLLALSQGPDAISRNVPFKQLKQKISRHIKKADVMKITQLFDEDTAVEEDALRRVNNCDDLFKLLKEKRLFDENNLFYLQVLLDLHFDEEQYKPIKQLFDLYVKATETSPLSLTDRIKRDPCNEFKYVELIITGDRNHFFRHTFEVYQEKLAAMLNIGKHNVRFEAVNEGSILLVILIPSTSVVQLKQAALCNDERLIEMKIICIHIQGEDYIPVIGDDYKPLTEKDCISNQGIITKFYKDFMEITETIGPNVTLKLQYLIKPLYAKVTGLRVFMEWKKKATHEWKGREAKKKAFSDSTLDDFVRCWRALMCVVIRSIPCLRSVLKQWLENKRETIKSCQRPRPRPPENHDECSEEGKPGPASSCANCVAWGNAVEDECYSQTSKASIPWDTINPMCLSRSHFMIAKAFFTKSVKAMTCTKLEDLDLGCLLDIMITFKGFMGQQESSYDIVGKIRDIKSMLIEMHEKKNFNLNDQQVKDIYSHIDSFISFLQVTHPQWFTSKDADDIRRAIQKIQEETITGKLWQDVDVQIKGCKDGARSPKLDMVTKIGQEHDAMLKKCREVLHQYYLDSLCKIPLFPGDYDSCVYLKHIYTKLSFEIKLPSPCRPVKMPLFSYSEMFHRKSAEGRSYRRFLISAPAGLGKTSLTAKIAYDWVTKGEEALQDIDLLFVINMRSVDQSSNLEEIILSQMFHKDTRITSEDISSLLQRYSQSTVIILDAIDESDRNLFDQENDGSLVKFLMGKSSLCCKLITTTRPWRIREITQECRAFAQVEISGFNKKDIREYIKKFFREDKELGDSLIRHANQNRLIDEIAYIPLMSLLICVYWREVQQDGIPHRISQLYDAIINIMHDHYLEKAGSTGQFDDIQALIYQMGKMALAGFWPPENRVVFSPNEMSNFENVERACQIGFLTKQESRPSIVKRSTRYTKTTLTFFHKTCGEKCAGEYLAHLAEEESVELMTKLSQLKTAEDALSVRLILQFACGSSKKAAKGILDWLMRLSRYDRSVCPDMVILHATERLKLEETLKIQNFMDLCLRCNYEANCAGDFFVTLRRLFPLITIMGEDENEVMFNQILVLGISAFTSVALGYYLSNSPSHIKWSIILRPAAHSCNPYVVAHGPLVNIMKKAQRDVNHIPVDIIRAICKEYIQKHPDMHYMNKETVNWSPASLLCYIHMWQACEGLPTADESDIGPILDSTQKMCLLAIDLNSFSIPKRNMEKLLDLISRNHLSSVQVLNVTFTNMTANQMLNMAKDLEKIPSLMELYVGQIQPRTHRFLSILAERMTLMKSLHILHIDNVTTSADDMSQFVCEFPRFASQLRELTMRHNPGIMTNTVASTLADCLVFAKHLEKFHIGFDEMVHKSVQNDLLSRLHYLSHLFEVQIFFKKYADDVVRTMAHAMKSLPNLKLLAFSASEVLNLTIDTTTWKELKTTLLGMAKLSEMRILHIWLKDEDFADLLAVCRVKHYEALMYSVVCVPKGFVVPDDEFLVLY